MRSNRFETRKPHRQSEPSSFGYQPQRGLCLPNRYPTENLVNLR